MSIERVIDAYFDGGDPKSQRIGGMIKGDHGVHRLVLHFLYPADLLTDEGTVATLVLTNCRFHIDTEIICSVPLYPGKAGAILEFSEDFDTLKITFQGDMRKYAQNGKVFINIDLYVYDPQLPVPEYYTGRPRV